MIGTMQELSTAVSSAPDSIDRGHVWAVVLAGGQGIRLRELALVGAVNVPIIYFSVKWWNTLHQGATVSLTAAPKMAAVMLAGMMAMAFAAWFYSIAVTLTRVRAIILERERHTVWVADAVAVRR